MSAPALGGKVLDASASIALVRGRLSVLTSIDVARTTGIPLYLPGLADLLGHPWVVLGELATATAAAVEQLLERAADTHPAAADPVEVVDALAGHVVHVACTRD